MIRPSEEPGIVLLPNGKFKKLEDYSEDDYVPITKSGSTSRLSGAKNRRSIRLIIPFVYV